MRSALLATTIAGGVLAGLIGQTAQAAAPASPQGYITYRTYPGDQRTGIQAGTAVPDGVFYPKRLEGPYNGFPGDDPGDDDTPPAGDVRNNYNSQLLGYFYPPKNGKIQFAIATDDPGQLYFSTDDNPANKQLIATESQWNPVRAFGGGDPTAPTRRNLVTTGDPPVPRPENWSKFIDVVAGKPYYIEAVGTEFGGGDNTAVAFRYDGDPDFADGDKPIPGSMLSTFDRSDLALPYVSGFSSTPGSVTFLLHDGTDPGGKQVDAASIKVSIDGTTVPATANKSGAITTVFSSVSPFFAPNSSHTAKVDFNGTSTEKSFSVVNYKTLTPDLKVTADTSKPGFSVLTYQVDSGLPNTIAAAEQVLLGVWKDANGDNSPNIADLSGAGADGRFVIDSVINFSDADADTVGNFQSDTATRVPGISTGDNYAEEILTYLDLPAGIITMGVNSDDGFQTTAGNVKDVLARIPLGEFNGGRGASDTIFTFEVKEAGIYPFRTIWFEGGGDSNVEWFTINDGKKVLINDKADSTAIKAYRAASTPLPVSIKSVSPAPGASGVGVRSDVSVVLVDGGNTVDQGSIKLSLNGQAVSPKITKTGGETAVVYTPTTDLTAAAKIAAEVSYKDSAGTSRTATWSFQIEIPTSIFGAGTLFIEAEDVDFTHGKFVTDKKIGMDGPYDGGAYKDLGTADDKGFDWNVDSNNGQAYRSETALAAGKENGSAGSDRGSFQVTSWWTLGWNDAGEWYNYTRDFPTPAKDYAVYGHLSSGGSPINIQVDQITAGQGQDDSKQVKKLVGYFAPGRATAGWDNLEIFQLTDANGEPAIVNLGGRTTLRTTILAGSNSDQDYFAFVPSTGPAAKPKFTKFSLSGGKLTIEWSGNAKLQKADTIIGPWTDVAGATSPRTIDPTGDAAFYRLQAQ